MFVAVSALTVSDKSGVRRGVARRKNKSGLYGGKWLVQNQFNICQGIISYSYSYDDYKSKKPVCGWVQRIQRLSLV